MTNRREAKCQVITPTVSALYYQLASHIEGGGLILLRRHLFLLGLSAIDLSFLIRKWRVVLICSVSSVKFVFILIVLSKGYLTMLTFEILLLIDKKKKTFY